MAWPRWLAEPDREEYWKVKQIENQATPLLLVLSPDPGAGNVIENFMPGYQIQVVTQPAEALAEIGYRLPQRLIIDQSIQAHPHTEALLHHLPYDLPVMVFSIPGSMATFHPLPDGVVGYLPKPVLRENLIEALGRLPDPLGHLWVIDDDPSMARFVQLSFATMPIDKRPTLTHLDCGQAVRKQMQQIAGQPQSAPDAILLDLGLPDVAGWDLLQELNREFSSGGLLLPPVILFTAVTLSEELEARSRKVFQISTLHPFSGEDLGTVIRSLLLVIHPRFSSSQIAPAQTKNPAG